MLAEIVSSFNKLINQEKQNRFTYSKTKLDWDNPLINVYEYKFQFPQNPERKDGSARVIYKTLSYFDNVEGNIELSRILTKKGIKPTDIVVHIKEFFPNGRGLGKNILSQYERHGFGTEILNFIIKESITEGAKAVYVFTLKDRMANFARKNLKPFDEKDSRNCRFYKILDHKQ